MYTLYFIFYIIVNNNKNKLTFFKNIIQIKIWIMYNIYISYIVFIIHLREKTLTKQIVLWDSNAGWLIHFNIYAKPKSAKSYWGTTLLMNINSSSHIRYVKFYNSNLTRVKNIKIYVYTQLDSIRTTEGTSDFIITIDNALSVQYSVFCIQI